MSRRAIICVDDERVILISLRDQLSHYLGNQYNIELAESGEEALEIFEELREDEVEIPLIISDQIMPGMKGDELLIKIHAQYPETFKILLTGQASAEAVGNAANFANLYRYIAKPWEKTDLCLTVTEAIRSYVQDKELAQKNQELQKINTELEKFNSSLEQKVIERTVELTWMNTQLQREIVERKLLEEKLSTSEKQIRAVFEAMTDIVLMIDEQGAIEIAPTNPNRFYAPNIDLFALTIEQFFQEEKGEIWFGKVGQAIKTQQTVNFDYSLLINGQEVWFTASISPLLNNSVIWVARDISERKQTEAALLQSEAKFAGAFRSSPSAITITRLSDGCHIEVNDSFCQFIGYSHEEILGKTAIELDIWVNVEDRIQLFQILQKKGTICNYEFPSRTKSGVIKTALLSAELINLDGEICVIAVSQDITDRKQAEADMQKAKEAADHANLAKSQFLANMSHELRTPLNAILGFTQLLVRDSSLKQEQQEYLEIIIRSGEHLLGLINDVLQMSKIEVGKVTLNQNNFDLYRLLHSLEVMFQLPAQAKGLQLVFDYDSNLPHYVQADESKLRQVLINLLGNAVKFTEEGGVKLRVRGGDRETVGVENPDSTSFSLLFEVEDTGPGIAPEEMDTLFEAFTQTATGRKSLEGTGLGLPISQKFVQLMGGEITVRSTLGKGAIFTFEVKIHLGTSAEIETPQPTRRVIGLAAGQPEYRLLVVDDRFESRLFLVKLLTSLGFVVQEAANGQEAVDQWNAFAPQLIWMDMRMPIMDGYEATRQIKAKERERRESRDQSKIDTQATVIIALTASAFEEERHLVLSAGCDDFVRKPFREQVIFEKMAQYLGVRFIYEELTSLEDTQGVSSGGNGTGGKQDSLFILQSSSFQVMSAEWVKALYQAADSVDNEQIYQLIEQIPPTYTPLAKAIADLVNNFRCDKIIDLIEAVGADGLPKL